MATLQVATSPLILSDNAGQMTVLLSSGEVLYAQIGSKNYLIPLSTGRTYTIELSDLLRALPIAKPSFPQAGYRVAATCQVTFNAGPEDLTDTTGRVTATLNVLMGGLYGHSQAEVSNIFAAQGECLTLLSGRDTRRYTPSWGKEFVGICTSGTGLSGAVVADVEIDGDGWNNDLPLTYLTDISAGTGYIINAGLDKIAEAVQAQLHQTIEYILAYRVKIVEWANADRTGTRTESQHILVRPMATKANYRGFVYRNSLGCWDTVYSRGDFSVVPKNNYGTFVNGNTEGQYNGEMTETYEVNSGPLDSALERRMWLEMLSSDEVYMVDQNSDMRLIVIDEASPSLNVKFLEDVTFKCHYAARPVGNGERLTIFD